MTTYNCANYWGKVAPRQGRGRKSPFRVRVGDAKFVR